MLTFRLEKCTIAAGLNTETKKKPGVKDNEAKWGCVKCTCKMVNGLQKTMEIFEKLSTNKAEAKKESSRYTETKSGLKKMYYLTSC